MQDPSSSRPPGETRFTYRLIADVFDALEARGYAQPSDPAAADRAAAAAMLAVLGLTRAYEGAAGEPPAVGDVLAVLGRGHAAAPFAPSGRPARNRPLAYAVPLERFGDSRFGEGVEVGVDDGEVIVDVFTLAEEGGHAVATVALPPGVAATLASALGVLLNVLDPLDYRFTEKLGRFGAALAEGAARATGDHDDDPDDDDPDDDADSGGGGLDGRVTS